MLGRDSPFETFYMSSHSTKNFKENINDSLLFKLGETNNRHPVYQLDCGFTFRAYVKNIRQKTTKCSLKTAEVLLDDDGHVLTQVRYLSKDSSYKLS